MTNQSWLERRQKAVPQAISQLHPLVAESTNGAKITDIEGRTYYDFCSGIGVMNVGHSHPRVVAAIQNTSRQYQHTCFGIVMYREYIELAEKINARVPIEGPVKTLFMNSGAEAVENAVKVARKFTKRTGAVCFERGFHGRTLMGMSLTSKTKPYCLGYGPFAPEVYRLPYAPFFGHLERPEAEVTKACHTALTNLINYHVEAENIACIIMEPVLGEGGFYPAHPAAIRAIRDFTARHGIVMIADEVQAGFGRSGSLFACERYGIKPDLMTMAKALGGGMPLSAVAGKAVMMDASHVGGLGGTYAGNPVACAAALAILDIMDEPGFYDQVNHIGSEILATFHALKSSVNFIGEINGLGAMCGAEIVNPETGEPDPERANAIVAKARDLGLLIMTASGNVIRILSPLVITKDELLEALSLLKTAFTSV